MVCLGVGRCPRCRTWISVGDGGEVQAHVHVPIDERAEAWFAQAQLIRVLRQLDLQRRMQAAIAAGNFDGPLPAAEVPDPTGGVGLLLRAMELMEANPAIDAAGVAR